MPNEKLQACTKCRECRFYDPSPFPGYAGKLAKCTNPNKNFVGAGVIGYYTLASSECFKRKEEIAEMGCWGETENSNQKT